MTKSQAFKSEEMVVPVKSFGLYSPLSIQRIY